MFISQNTIRFAKVTGSGGLRFWQDLPRENQERLFEEAVADDEALGDALALSLHDRHPRTAYPPRPLAPTP